MANNYMYHEKSGQLSFSSNAIRDVTQLNIVGFSLLLI